jgi:hypothetical protein
MDSRIESLNFGHAGPYFHCFKKAPRNEIDGFSVSVGCNCKTAYFRWAQQTLRRNSCAQPATGVRLQVENCEGREGRTGPKGESRDTNINRELHELREKGTGEWD